MARRDEQQRKLELLEQLSRQRAQITSQRSRLTTQIAYKTEEIKNKINVPRRIKDSVRSSFSSSPTKWFIGSAIGGLILSKIIIGRRSAGVLKSSVYSSKNVSRSLLVSALFYFGKPYLKRMMINKAKLMLLRKFMPQAFQTPEEQRYERYR